MNYTSKPFVKFDYRVVVTRDPNGKLSFGFNRAFYHSVEKNATPDVIDDKPISMTNQDSQKALENEVNAFRRAMRKPAIIGWPGEDYLKEYNP